MSKIIIAVRATEYFTSYNIGGFVGRAGPDYKLIKQLRLNFVACSNLVKKSEDPTNCPAYIDNNVLVLYSERIKKRVDILEDMCAISTEVGFKTNCYITEESYITIYNMAVDFLLSLKFTSV